MQLFTKLLQCNNLNLFLVTKTCHWTGFSRIITGKQGKNKCSCPLMADIASLGQAFMMQATSTWAGFNQSSLSVHFTLGGARFNQASLSLWNFLLINSSFLSQGTAGDVFVQSRKTVSPSTHARGINPTGCVFSRLY